MATNKNGVSSSSSETSDVEDVKSRAGWRVSGWKLRNKIALALAFPMVAASWFAVDKSVEAWIVAEEYRATAGQIRVLGPTIDYLYAAESATVVARSESASNSPARTEAVEKVRQAAEKLEAQIDDEALTQNQKAQLEGLVALSDQLRDGRAYVTLLQSLSQVRQLHNGVSDFYQSIVNGQNAPEPVLQQIGYVMEGRLAFTMQQLQVAYQGNRITNSSDVFSALGVEDAAISQLARARNDAPDVLDLRSLNASRFDTVEKGTGELAYEEALEVYDSLSEQVLTESEEALDENAAEAGSQAVLNIVILAASLLATLLLAWIIARLMTRPVLTVRDSAREVASTKLPQAVATIRAGGDPGAIDRIPVHTNEEMGQLARAVDELHQTAVDLAQGEAQLRTQVGEMFVTLSRRNTSLINQQLGLIEELERDEQDPRRLESLFRLDHLAARQRRTAESLVILSDAPVRQRDAHSLSLNDALQAATAGVQEYQRVEMRGASSEQLVGAVANDVVHLLTELIDNALSFSPPTEPVHVSTTSAVGQTVISVSDGGLGLPEDVLQQLNGMLRSDVGITPDAARRMGLFVVSRLAHRHDLDVKLSKNGRGGVTATVGIPDSLLVGGSKPETVVTAPPPIDVPSTIDVPAQASAPVITPTVAPVIEPVVEPVLEEPAAPAAKASTPDPLNDPLPAPLGDPLTDPLPQRTPSAPEPTPAPVAKAPEIVAPEVVVEPEEDRQVEQINAAISAVTGLPKRRPGATVPGRQAAVAPAGGSLFGGAAEAPEAVEEPAPVEEVVPEPVALVEAPAPAPEVAPEPDPNVSMFARTAGDDGASGGKAESGALGMFSLREARAARAAAAGKHADPVAEEKTPTQDEAPAAVAPAAPAISPEDPLGLDAPKAAPVVEASQPEVHAETQTETQAASAPQALPAESAELVVDEASEPEAPAAEPAAANGTNGALPTRTPGTNGIVPPATQAPASGWLGNGPQTSWGTSADAGWQAAHRANESEAVPTATSGLPQRQPGRRLVPGSVAPTRTAPARDPEAIRKRLAAHAAGVSRGRSASATTTNTQKEGPA
ncbi:ATP-binding protein [Nocardioides daphniae]|uniref:histidine kinase n=1 Tax=Nocardioides daphniae TaxID=402297 RepID=A0A4P7UCK6_9ACTN|nr:ATP-binding protein [Nocardioides daphniae]QCC77241.1 HAMP domain-containing protein [Nocardioides daphniae]GGD26305.1 hypothetical protein GCM10007231_27170 [Nocardioides daphniae]